jgi:hypothetical protein
MTKQQMIDQLKEVIDPDYLLEWLDTSNQAFDWQTPMQLIEEERFDEILSMIDFLKFDVYF